MSQRSNNQDLAEVAKEQDACLKVADSIDTSPQSKYTSQLKTESSLPAVRRVKAIESYLTLTQKKALKRNSSQFPNRKNKGNKSEFGLAVYSTDQLKLLKQAE